MNQKISVVIITLNEERIIEKCLSKLSFADEIIVVDSGSSDKTVAICEKLGAKVFYNKFEGYGLQKQFAVDKTRNNWILSLDADEVLCDDLVHKIPKALDNNKGDVVAYYIKHQLVFLNKKFKYGKDGNHYMLRFFNKLHGNFDSNAVHERIQMVGKKEKLNGSFLHYSYESLEDYLVKLNKYTSLYALSKAEKNKHYSFFLLILKAKFDFFKKYFVDLNFMNGKEGFFWAFYASVYTLTKCLKTNDLYKINHK